MPLEQWSVAICLIRSHNPGLAEDGPERCRSHETWDSFFKPFPSVIASGQFHCTTDHYLHGTTWEYPQAIIRISVILCNRPYTTFFLDLHEKFNFSSLFVSRHHRSIILPHSYIIFIHFFSRWASLDNSLISIAASGQFFFVFSPNEPKLLSESTFYLPFIQISRSFVSSKFELLTFS